MAAPTDSSAGDRPSDQILVDQMPSCQPVSREEHRQIRSKFIPHVIPALFFWLEEADQCQADLQLLRAQVQSSTVLKTSVRENVNLIKQKVASLEVQLKQAMELNRHYLTNQMKLINVLKQKNLEHYSFKLQIKKEKRHLALLVLEIESLRHRACHSYLRRLRLVLSSVPGAVKKQVCRGLRDVAALYPFVPIQMGFLDLISGRSVTKLNPVYRRCVQTVHAISMNLLYRGMAGGVAVLPSECIPDAQLLAEIRQLEDHMTIVRTLLHITSTEGERFLNEGNFLQEAIQTRAEEIRKLKQELRELRKKRPILENNFMNLQEDFDDDGRQIEDVLKIVRKVVRSAAEWVQCSLNAFRVFVPM